MKIKKNSHDVIANLQVDKELFDLVCQEICPKVGFEVEKFWQKSASIFNRFSKRNTQLLNKRLALQKKIDNWHDENPYPFDSASYQAMLEDIGYIVPRGADFSIETRGIDDDICSVCAPQLVAPIDNVRYVLNAANARWGSLTSALNVSNLIERSDTEVPQTQSTQKQNQQIFDYLSDFLDQSLPLQEGHHRDATGYDLVAGQLAVFLPNIQTGLRDPSLLVGYSGEKSQPKSLLFRHNGLHIEVVVRERRMVDVILESALTCIQDFEDSVSAVDGEDKRRAHANWFALMQGTLSVDISKNGKVTHRSLNADRSYTDLKGNAFSLSGRSTLLVRSKGFFIKTPAVLDAEGNEMFEAILDIILITLSSLKDIDGNQNGYRNSKKGSLYIVIPKMHGPEETAFCNDLMAEVEDMFSLPRYTLKIGLMDEEKRTSLNLAESMRMIKNRLFLINTGFLDRTGDEIHTAMRAGAFCGKDLLRKATWLSAYEDQNVEIGLRCGFYQQAQIGKGMWAKPDDMKQMMEQKIGHLKAGANTSWVPSPIAATLHAIHYHQIDVFHMQRQISERAQRPLTDLLKLSLIEKLPTPDEVQRELDNSCQTLLGYVVRWVDKGVGCSKVFDLNQVALMEDCATLRISSQLIANWLFHELVSVDQIHRSLARVAVVVDQQNKADSQYENLAPELNSIAYQVANDLIFKGRESPNGYTELILYAGRQRKKREQRQS